MAAYGFDFPTNHWARAMDSIGKIPMTVIGDLPSVAYYTFLSYFDKYLDETIEEMSYETDIAKHMGKGLCATIKQDYMLNYFGVSGNNLIIPAAPMSGYAPLGSKY